MDKYDRKEVLAWCNTIKSALNSLQFAAPEIAHVHYDRIKEAEQEIRRLATIPQGDPDFGS